MLTKVSRWFLHCNNSKYIETLDQKTLVVLICAEILFLRWQMCEKAISMESMFGNNSLAHSRLPLPYFYQQWIKDLFAMINTWIGTLLTSHLDNWFKVQETNRETYIFIIFSSNLNDARVWITIKSSSFGDRCKPWYWTWAERWSLGQWWGRSWSQSPDQGVGNGASDEGGDGVSHWIGHRWSWSCGCLMLIGSVMVCLGFGVR